MRSFVISTMALGGSARALANLANHFAARGDAVEIVTLHGGIDAYPLHRAVRRRELDFRASPRCSAESLHSVVATAARFPQVMQLAADAQTCAALRDVLAEEPREAVVGIGDATSVRVIMATRDLPVRAIGWEQTDPHAYGSAWHAARRCVYPLADALVVLMPEHAEAFPGARCVAIPNAAVPFEGDRARGTGDRRVVVGLGRLTWEKGFDILIEAFARIAARNPEWTLEIHGEGGQRAALQVLIARRGLEGRVLLPGTTRDTWSVLARADLFALASYAEGFPNALLEAMAAGVAPVVVSCGPAVASIVRDGVDGLRVPRDVESLAAAMERLMLDDDERAQLASRAVEVVERFSIEKVAAQWDALFDTEQEETIPCPPPAARCPLPLEVG